MFKNPAMSDVNQVTSIISTRDHGPPYKIIKNYVKPVLRDHSGIDKLNASAQKNAKLSIN